MHGPLNVKYIHTYMYTYICSVMITNLSFCATEWPWGPKPEEETGTVDRIHFMNETRNLKFLNGVSHQWCWRCRGGGDSSRAWWRVCCRQSQRQSPSFPQLLLPQPWSWPQSSCCGAGRPQRRPLGRWSRPFCLPSDCSRLQPSSCGGDEDLTLGLQLTTSRNKTSVEGPSGVESCPFQDRSCRCYRCLVLWQRFLQWDCGAGDDAGDGEM